MSKHTELDGYSDPTAALRSFFHSLANVSANVINANPEECKQLHKVADLCADEYSKPTASVEKSEQERGGGAR